jgi:hypothetical protein
MACISIDATRLATGFYWAGDVFEFRRNGHVTGLELSSCDRSLELSN